MNEETFIESMNEYYSYRSKLDKISNESNSIINDFCYLIDENWFNELIKNYQRFINTKNISIGIEFNKLINFPKRGPYFINNFTELIEIIKNKIEFKLISRNLMELICKKEYLKKFNYVKYYGKNNKLIIEYQIKDENKSLLIVDPFELIKREIFIIIFNDIDKRKLYENILSVKYTNETIFQKNQNIIPFDEYIKGNINFPLFETKDKGNENIQELNREQIFKIFIKIFLYEKNIIKNMSNKEGIYYLINPKWLNKYKKYYNYKEIRELLEKLYNNNVKININNIIKYKSFEQFKFKNYLENNLYEIKPISENKSGIEFINQCSIIPQEIFELIRYLIIQNEKLIIQKARALAKNNYIYLFHSLNIEIGTINEDLIFNTKYIFKYNSKEIYHKEKENLTNNTIVDNYIESRMCNKNKINLQELVIDYNKRIGYLIVLKGINNKVRGKSAIINSKRKETKNEEFNKQRKAKRKITTKEKEANIKKNILNNIQAYNNNKSPKNIKLNKNKNLNIGKTNNILTNNNVYENFINDRKNVQNLCNQLNTHIKSDENNFGEEALNKLNDNFLHNRLFIEDNKKEELNNPEERANNGQNENKDKKYENFEKEINNKIKVIEETNYLNKDELNNLDERNLYNQIGNKDETYENIQKEIIYQNKANEENIKREEIKKENEMLKLFKKNNEENLKFMKNKIEEYNLLNKNFNEVFEGNEFLQKDYNSKINMLKEKENVLKFNFQHYIQENEKAKKQNEIIKKENEEKENQIKNKHKKYEYDEIKEEIEKYKRIYGQINKDKELEINNNEDKNQKYNRNEENEIIDNKEEEQQIYDILKNKPIISYNSPTLIGLNNIGATCFMNATLQCLSQTEGLSNYFLCQKNINKIINNNIALKNKNDLQLSPSYLNLIHRLWDANNAKSSFSPNDFRNIVEQLNPLFKSGQPGDSKDFIIFILEQIHKELRAPISIMFNNQNTPNFLNQYDKDNAFNYFFSQFSKECSVISDIFFGVNETTNICLNCKNYSYLNGLNYPICYNYGIFNCLIFPLEEVKNMKNKNSVQMNNYFQTANEVSLEECFTYNQKSEVFTGENRNYCNICRQLYDSIYTSKIFITPNVLILILNRGRGNIYNIKLNFTEKIDISQFVLQKEKPQLLYELYGVITHIGQSGPNAHFIASCKSPVDFKWYRYNDAIVNPITNLQKEVIEFGTPYILFYQKV